MSTPPSATLATIREKIARLADERDEALARVAELESKVSDLETDLEETRKDLHKARLDVEFLTVSYRLADNPDALLLARKKIASLIRKVDSALNLVKNDPADA